MASEQQNTTPRINGIYRHSPGVVLKEIFCLYACLLISGEGDCPKTNRESRKWKKTQKEKAEICCLLSKQQSKIALKALLCCSLCTLHQHSYSENERGFTLNHIIFVCSTFNGYLTLFDLSYLLVFLSNCNSRSVAPSQRPDD